MTPDDKLVMSSMTKVRNSLIRNFSYKLTDKKATNNFLKAASREPIEIEEKQRCTVLTFSVGSVHPLSEYDLNGKNYDQNMTNFYHKLRLKYD